MDILHYVLSLPPQAQTAIRVVVWLLLLAVLFVPLERLFAERPAKIRRVELMTDIGYNLLNGMVATSILAIPLGFVAWATQKWMPSGVAAWTAHWPMWQRAAIAMVIGETGFYWGHRLSHEIPLLWRFHAIHHSAEHVDWLVSTRGHPVDVVFTRIVGFTPLILLGLTNPLSANPGTATLLLLIVGNAWGYFVHANVWWRFGPLEWLIATPAFHRWHHTNDGAAYVNKNYAPMLPWIDWIFGSLYLPPHQQPKRVGIDSPMPRGLLLQLVEPCLFWKPGNPLLRAPPAPKS